jgi:hypothetical protein
LIWLRRSTRQTKSLSTLGIPRKGLAGRSLLLHSPLRPLGWLPASQIKAASALGCGMAEGKAGCDLAFSDTFLEEVATLGFLPLISLGIDSVEPVNLSLD